MSFRGNIPRKGLKEAKPRGEVTHSTVYLPERLAGTRVPISSFSLTEERDE